MRKIPTEDAVKKAIEEVLREHGEVSTLTRFRKLVLAKLKEEDEDFSLSATRLRKIAGRMGIIAEIHYRQSEETSENMEKCPVCSSPLRFLLNKRIDGGIVKIGLKCDVCGYSTGTKKKIPIKYSFAFK